MKKMLVILLVLFSVSVASASFNLVNPRRTGPDEGMFDIYLTEGALQGYTMFLDVTGGTAGPPGEMADFLLDGTTPINLVAPSAAANQGGHDWKYVGAGITGFTFITGPIAFIKDIPIAWPGTGTGFNLTLTVPSGGTR